MSIEDDPISAAALQLVSPSARALLLPILYEVFTVRWARNAPSLVLMLRMVTELPTPAFRAHIRHLVFILPTRHALTTLPKTKFASSEGWHVDSVALRWDSAFKPNLLRMVAWHFRLRPRRLFIDSHGDFLGVAVGAGVQQRLPEGRFPEYEGFIAHIEEVHTTCSFFALEESRYGREFGPEYAGIVLQHTLDHMLVTGSYRASHLRITIEMDATESISMASNTVILLLRCPGVSVTIILPIPTSTVSENSTTSSDTPLAWLLCEALRGAPDLAAGTALRKKTSGSLSATSSACQNGL